jgi:transcriptional regulator with XRE-family HTH domain
MGLEEVASQLLCSPSKISRLETGARGASPRDVRDLCRIYAADDATRAYLMDLAQEAKQRGWWQHFDEVFPDYPTYIDLEGAASDIQVYETVLVHGLLQTTDYSLALMRRINLRLGTEAAEQYANSRRERQKRLLGGDRPAFWAILDEAAIRRQVGGPKIMADQIAHLVECAEQRRVILQIIPFEAGAHAGMEGNFTVLRFEDSDVPDHIYVEGRAGHLFLSRDEDLRLYRETFDHLRATAASPDESLEFLRRLSVN